jgi:hypothetical protein
MPTLPTISAEWNAAKTQLYVKGIWSASNTYTQVDGITPSTVKLLLRKNCESCGCTDVPDSSILNEITLNQTTDDTLVGTDYVYVLEADHFTDGNAGDVFNDGIYNVEVEYTVVYGATVLKYYNPTCAAQLAEMSCNIVSLILNVNEDDDFLVNAYNAVSNAIACNKCCEACSIYKMIQDKLAC